MVLSLLLRKDVDITVAPPEPQRPAGAVTLCADQLHRRTEGVLSSCAARTIAEGSKPYQSI
jgi:hypothetical protein